MSAIGETLFPEQSGSLQTLPLELVLRIIDTLALDLRDSAPARARALFLISRAVRQSLLPLLYGALVIDAGQTPGWDGQPCTHPGFSFLAWLLGTPSAEPRCHIKNLVLRTHGASVLTFESEPKRLGLDGNTKTSNPSWFLDNLIVTTLENARHLERVGVCARAAHCIGYSIGINLGESIGLDVTLFASSLRQEGPKGRACVRVVTQPIGDSLSSEQANRRHDASHSWASLLMHQELDPRREYKIREVPESSRGAFVFIDVGSADGFGNLSAALLGEIALIFQKDADETFHVIIVYPQSEKDIVIRDSAERLRAHCAVQVHGRLWITRSSADRRLMTQDPYLGMARAFQQGIDPWDMGRRITEIMVEDK